MGVDQVKRFERWSKKLPENTSFFANTVLGEVVPMFTAHGFERPSDYAGGSTFSVGPNCVALELRRGEQWPAVEIVFDPRMKPKLSVQFALLPAVCTRWTQHGSIVRIPRIEASVVDAPAFFVLCKGKKGRSNRDFGYELFSFNPTRRLQEEVAVLQSLLPWLFNALLAPPEAWFRSRPGYVDAHAFLSPASRMFTTSSAASGRETDSEV